MSYDEFEHNACEGTVVTCGDANDIFAVGEEGSILHFDGAQWERMSSGTTRTLTDVWGSAPDDVYAITVGNTLLHYDGSNWGTIAGAVTGVMRDIWGSSDDNIIVVGDAVYLIDYIFKSGSPPVEPCCP